MTKAMIIEDNKDEAVHLQNTLLRLQPDFAFLSFEDGKEALTYLENEKMDIDIFFIDCVLPHVDGFTLAERIRNIEGNLLVPIIFVTGYNINPLNAFQEYHCYGFLQKPYTIEILQKSIGPLLKTLSSQKKKEKKPLKKVVHLVAREIETYVYAEDILALEILGRDCIVYTKEDQYKLPRMGLVKLVQEIGEPYIVRCHKSFAINLLHISGVRKKGRNLWAPIFRRKCNIDCEISKTYYAKVMMRYKELFDRLL